MSSNMSRTTTKVGLIVLGFAMAVTSMLVAVDPELGLGARIVLAGALLLGGLAFMVKALVFDTDPPIRHRAERSGSRS